MLDDKDTFAKRISRYTQVGIKAGSIASRVALDKLTATKDPDQRAALLYEALGQLRGPLMKVPQLLATIPDFLPPAYQEKFMNLQANVPPMGSLFVKRRMRGELGNDWMTHFTEFDPQARFAASLGQVHQARLTDNTLVACKLQYPDMPSTVAADLNQLKTLISLYQRANKAIQTDEVLEEIAEHITQELDYNREAKNMAAYHSIFADEPDVNVPIPYPDLTTERLLTMGWLDGVPITRFSDAPQAVRNQLATSLFKAWYKPLYQYGVLHGDPHMGNYTVNTENHTINLLDFGCVRYFEPSVIQGVVELYHALKHDDTDRAYEAYKLWGFSSVPKDLLQTLNQWARYLYGPVLIDREVDLIQEFPSLEGQRIAGEVLTKLKSHGGIKPPRSFVFMDRSAVGIGSVFLRLNAKLNWHVLYESYIADFSEESMKNQQKSLYVA